MLHKITDSDPVNVIYFPIALAIPFLGKSKVIKGDKILCPFSYGPCL
jgi:hypothetical protein